MGLRFPGQTAERSGELWGRSWGLEKRPARLECGEVAEASHLITHPVVSLSSDRAGQVENVGENGKWSTSTVVRQRSATRLSTMDERNDQRGKLGSGIKGLRDSHRT